MSENIADMFDSGITAPLSAATQLFDRLHRASCICRCVSLNLKVGFKARFFELMMSVPMNLFLRVLKSRLLAIVVMSQKSRDRKAASEFALVEKVNES